jgi:hypothetical protein
MYSYQSNNELNINEPFNLKLSLYDDSDMYPVFDDNQVCIHKDIYEKITNRNIDAFTENYFETITIGFPRDELEINDLQKIIDYYYFGNIEFDSFNRLFNYYCFCYTNNFYELKEILETLFDIDKIIKNENINDFLLSISEKLKDNDCDKNFLYQFVGDITKRYIKDI